MGIRKLLSILLLVVAIAFSGCTYLGYEAKKSAGFESDFAANSIKPWTNKALDADGDGMVFAVFGDRTGLHYPGKLQVAVEKINESNPDFVVSVGDHIEGYTRDMELLEKQWDEFDALISGLDSRFFKVPGNHDYSNHVVSEYYRKRYGRDYYYFVFENVLFLCLNTQNPPRERPEDNEKKMTHWMQSMVELTEKDPQKGVGSVQETLKKYPGTHGQAAISDVQVEYFKGVIDRYENVKWTFVFMHIPAWDASYECPNFSKLRQALKGRSHTVFAGHEHQYRLDIQDGSEYYRLGPTAAIPRDSTLECERQFLMVDFKGTMPKVKVVKVED